MHNNIDQKLKDFFDYYKDTPFQWGVTDCSRVSAKWVKRFIGKDIECEMPDYRNEVEAMAVLESLGYNSQEDSLDHYFKRVNKNFLRRGDLVGHYFMDTDYMAIGVNAGEVALFIGPKGLVTLPYKKISRELCWRVE